MLQPLNDIKTILIIRCGALGDLVYSTAVMDALRSQYGDEIQIDWVCTPGPGTLFAKDPRVRQVFNLKNRKPPLWLSPQKRTIVRYSKAHPYDLLINFETGKQFYGLTKAIVAKNKIGTPFTQPRHNPSAVHMVDIIKQIYAAVIDPKILCKSYPGLYGTPWEEIKKRYALPERYIVFNPSNSHNKRHRLNYRAWPQRHWKELLELMHGEIPIVVIAGKGEETYFESIRPFPNNVIDLVGKTPLVDLVGIIDHAKAIVTTDTGPAHLASALNTPVFVMIGPTPFENTGPYVTPNNKVTVLSAGVECSPCYKTPVMFACNDNRCMSEITSQQVHRALKPLMAKIN